MARGASSRRALTSPADTVVTAGAGLAAALVALGLTLAAPAGSLAHNLLPGVAAVFAAGLFLSPRYEQSLLLFLLYIGLADGYLKLSTGIPNITLLRDLLLYSIVGGAAVRLIVRRDRLTVPPMTGLVIAWVVIVLVQIFNPNGQTLSHGLTSARQHLEFVPLFFFGYAILRTNGRLRAVLTAAVVVAVGNAIANIVQFNLTPAQLASWGPGYAALVNGTGTATARIFSNGVGGAFVRPFGLGGDFGFGGIVCAFAVGPALALVILARNNKLGLAVAVPGLAFAIIGLATSGSRTSAIGAVIAALAFSALSIVSRKSVVSLLTVAVVGAGAYWLVANFASQNQQSGLTRFESVAPDKVVGTTLDSRGGSLATIPSFALAHPLGVGLGTLGPAASQGDLSVGVDTGANAENEVSFLLAEVGIGGALILMTLLVASVGWSVRVVRACRDPVERVLLAGLTAPMFVLLIVSFTGTWSTASYTAGYFWLVAGAIVARR
jgi:hypothetical protein